LAEKIERKISKGTEKSLRKAEFLKEKLAHVEEKAECKSVPLAEKKLKKLEKKSEKMTEKIERKLEKGTPESIKKAGELKTKLAKVDGKKAAMKAVISRPVARYIRDITYSDGTVVAAGSSFIKTWRMHNDGTGSWKDVVLMHVGGESMSAPAATSVPNVAAGAMADVSVALIAPSTPGRHCGYFRLATKEGTRFGHRIWVDIIVNATAVPVTAPVEVAEAPPVAIPVATVAVPAVPAAIPVVEKWDTEIAIIRAMGFNNARDVIVGLLETHSGDVNTVVMNLLA
jgi:hypothetical protein